MPLPDVDDDPDLAGRLRGPELLHRAAVRDHRVVHRLLAGPAIGDPRREHAQSVADPEGDGFVDRGPEGNAVAELLEGERRVVPEPLDRVAVRPSTQILESLGEVPVEQGGVRCDAVLEQGIDEVVVEVDPLLVDRTAAFGQEARPAQGEPIGVESDLLHQADVLLPAVVVVDRDIAGFVAQHLPRRLREGVPDRGSLPVQIPGSFDLIRARRGTEDEMGGKNDVGHVLPFDVRILAEVHQRIQADGGGVSSSRRAQTSSGIASSVSARV